jgi:cysteine-rich repeat protein
MRGRGTRMNSQKGAGRARFIDVPSTGRASTGRASTGRASTVAGRAVAVLAVAVLAVAVLVGGCFDGRVPDAAAIACRAEPDCPATFVCVAALGRCVPARDVGDVCGDGAPGADEECDDGPRNDDTAADACRTDCRRARCGDGVIDGGEQCDDGPANADDVPDACRSTCRMPLCGDGVVDGGEGCDDGSANSDAVTDACRTTCALPRCGDGVVDGGEGCDDGAANSDAVADACRTACEPPRCGDGVVDAGEACDEGAGNDDVVADACRTTCSLASCGDGVVDRGEACDDGNAADGDGCRGDCGKLERCDDGVVDANEACDDGDDNPRDGCDACRLQVWEREVWVSGSLEGRLATDGALTATGLEVDGVDRVFIADAAQHRVWRRDPDGTLTPVAGTGAAGFSGDGGAATSAELNGPIDVATDGFGGVYVLDRGNLRIRYVDPTGTIRTVAGNGLPGLNGDGGPAVAARFLDPKSLAVDGQGRIYLLDDVLVRRIERDGTIEKFAGGAFCDGFPLSSYFELFVGREPRGLPGEGGPASDAALCFPTSLSLTPDGALLVAEVDGVRRIGRDGVITTIAGGGRGEDDGADAQSTVLGGENDLGVTLDHRGRPIVWGGYRVRRLEEDGTLTTLAGTGEDGFDGDGGPATSARIGAVTSIAVDAQGRLYLALPGSAVVRMVAVDGRIATVAGVHPDRVSGEGFVAGGPATATELGEPVGVALDAAGRLVIADRFLDRVLRVELDGDIAVVAGDGGFGFSGDDGPALEASLARPEAVSFDLAGRLLIVDGFNCRVRRVDAGGTITTIAGNGLCIHDGDGGPAIDADLDLTSFGPMPAVAVDTLGRLFVAEPFVGVVRRIDVDGTISTVVGSVDAFFTGPTDGVRANEVSFSAMSSVVVDAAQRLYVGTIDSEAIWRIDTDGTVRWLAGLPVLTDSGWGDGLPARRAALVGVTDAIIDVAGNLLVVDGGVVRRVGPDGILRRFAGNVRSQRQDDGEPALASRLGATAIAADARGEVFVADGATSRVRVIASDGTIRTIAGRGLPTLNGSGRLAVTLPFRPTAVALDGSDRPTVAVAGTPGDIPGQEDGPRVGRIAADGVFEHLAGTLGDELCPDEGMPAAKLRFGTIIDIAVGDDGLVYVAEDSFVPPDDDDCTHEAGARVVVVDAQGAARTVAGVPLRRDPESVDEPVDPTLAFGAALDGLRDIVVDPQGRLVLVARDGVLRVEADGTLRRLAPSNLTGLVFDPQGRLHGILDGNGSVVRLDDEGRATTVLTPSPLVARHLAFDESGRLLIATASSVVRIEADQTRRIVVGAAAPARSAGDGGPAVDATLSGVLGLDVDRQGRVYVVDSLLGALRRVDNDGTIATVLGGVHPPGPGPFDAAKLYPARALVALHDERLVSVGALDRVLLLDGVTRRVEVVVGYPDASPGVQGRARYAPPLSDARGAALDPDARLLFVTEHDTATLRVVDLDVDDDGVLDDAAAWTSVTLPTVLEGPAGLAWDAATQTLVVADEDAACVRRIGRDGIVLATLAGRCGVRGSFPGLLDAPTHVAVAPTTGVVYVSDTGNNRVLRVQGGGATVVLGDGSTSSAGEGEPARRFPVQRPGQIALDDVGNLFVTSTTSVRMVVNVDGDADVDGDDRVLTIYGGRERTAFPESSSLCLSALAARGDDVFVADACQGFVVRLSSRTTR